jgi:anti-sigma regulatory factor (Ser/Thr protein kinase)
MRLASITTVSPLPEEVGVVADRTGAPVCDLASRLSWQCSRTFPARADQIPRSRAFMAQVLTDCQLAEDALLIVSELCTNAVLHSNSGQPDGHFTVRAEACEGDYLWIEVEDQGGRWTDRERSAEGGRGLDIVTALADYWDVRGDDNGWVVCARLDWPAAVRAPA